MILNIIKLVFCMKQIFSLILCMMMFEVFAEYNVTNSTISKEKKDEACTIEQMESKGGG